MSSIDTEPTLSRNADIPQVDIDLELRDFRLEVEAHEIARIALLDEDARWALFRRRIERGEDGSDL